MGRAHGAGEECFGLQRGSWLLHRKARVILAMGLHGGERPSVPRCRQCERASGYKVCRSRGSGGCSLYSLGKTHIGTLAEEGQGCPLLPQREE